MNTKKRIDQTERGEFFSYAIPAIISMLLSASIVIVDGVFIGHGIGPTGLASVNLTLPIFYVFLGVGVMISVGGSIIASHCRGAQKRDQANLAFSMTITVLFMAMAVLLLLLVIFFEPVLGFLKAESNLYQHTRDYLGTMRWFYPLNLMTIGLAIFMRTEGRPELSMRFGLFGNALNVIFDYLFILKMDMGLRGAALASGIAIIVSLTLSIHHFLSIKSYFSFCKPRLNKNQLFKIFYNGSSEMISQLSFGFSTWLFNWIILDRLGVNGLAAFTIVSYLIFIEGMVILGIATGIGPIVGVHFGAGNHIRIKNILKIALQSSLVVGVTAWLIVLILGESVSLAVSGGNTDVVMIAKRGYWIFTLAFLFSGTSVIISAFFTSLGKAKQSLIISTLRGLILNSLGVLILPLLWGDLGIWLSLPLGEFLTFILSTTLVVAYLNQQKKLGLL